MRVSDAFWELTRRFCEAVILSGIRLFGRATDEPLPEWIDGPFGGPHIGSGVYDEVARREGLTLERPTGAAGLIEDFDLLDAPSFDAGVVDERIRRFYEETTRFSMEIWAKAYFPASIALFFLVRSVSRRYDQLNFPVSALEAAEGISSEVLHLRDAEGRLRYAGWLRRFKSDGRSLYTGFYSPCRPPEADGRHVKVIFPCPDGNATVVLAPRNGADGGMELRSGAAGGVGTGFFRIQRMAGRTRVWHVRSLEERFRLWVDGEGRVRCDHDIRFLGLRVTRLHYLINERPRPTV